MFGAILFIYFADRNLVICALCLIRHWAATMGFSSTRPTLGLCSTYLALGLCSTYLYFLSFFNVLNCYTSLFSHFFSNEKHEVSIYYFNIFPVILIVCFIVILGSISILFNTREIKIFKYYLSNIKKTKNTSYNHYQTYF